MERQNVLLIGVLLGGFLYGPLLYVIGFDLGRQSGIRDMRAIPGSNITVEACPHGSCGDEMPIAEMTVMRTTDGTLHYIVSACRFNGAVWLPRADNKCYMEDRP